MSRRTDRDYFLGCETAIHDKHILQDGVLVTDILGKEDGPHPPLLSEDLVEWLYSDRLQTVHDAAILVP